MSWDTTYYVSTAECPCGKGYIERKHYKREDDWNKSEFGISSETIMCPVCKSHYHIEHLIKHYYCPSWVGDGISDTAYCVPNGLTVNGFDTEYHTPNIYYSFEESIVNKFSKNDLLRAIDDMIEKKFSTRLNDSKVIQVYESFECYFRTKRFKNIIPKIKFIVDKYDDFVESEKITKSKIESAIAVEKKRVHNENARFMYALNRCKELIFENETVVI